MTTEIQDKSSPQPLPEPERVLWNRYDRFKELLSDKSKNLLPGISEECIKELASATSQIEVSPHRLKKLLEAGCSPELAVKILKPL